MRRHFALYGLTVIVTAFTFLPVDVNISAQDNIPILVTNTPRAPQPVVVPRLTNPPNEPISQFALRLWLETDLLDVVLHEIQLLESGDIEGALAVQLLQHELEHRFPDAPHDPVRREVMLRAMLAAPRGLIDIRHVARASIVDRFNEAQPSFDDSTQLTFLDDFNLEINSADFDGVPPRDALVHVRYPSSADLPGEIHYEDYIPMQIDADGSYHLMPGSEEIPASAVFSIQHIALENLADVNQDGTDEVAVSIFRQNEINREMLVYGWRGDQMVNLIAPGTALMMQRVREWSTDAAFVDIGVARIENEDWGCMERRPEIWTWQANFFHPPDDPRTFIRDNTLRCRLSAEEPLFAKSPEVAINTIRNIIGQPPSEEYSANRAAMMIAMLMVLDGQTEAARIQAENLQARAEPGTWLDEQTRALLSAIGDDDLHPIQICQLLVETSEQGSCDVGAVLGRVLSSQPLRRDLDIASQIELLGINVVEVIIVKEVGRLDRQVAHIEMVGDYWWAYAPLNASFYTAEMIEPLQDDEPIVITPPEFVTAPHAVQTLLSNDFRGTLVVIDNAQQQFPNVQLAPQERYIQALTLDILGDRIHALEKYYALWSEFPGTVWGQMAASHLEQRH